MMTPLRSPMVWPMHDRVRNAPQAHTLLPFGSMLWIACAGASANARISDRASKGEAATKSTRFD
jgi:hypothetical protein